MASQSEEMFTFLQFFFCIFFFLPCSLQWVQEVITKFKTAVSGLNSSLKHFLLNMTNVIDNNTHWNK